jgi:hypothetical protein
MVMSNSNREELCLGSSGEAGGAREAREGREGKEGREGREVERELTRRLL